MAQVLEEGLRRNGPRRRIAHLPVYAQAGGIEFARKILAQIAAAGMVDAALRDYRIERTHGHFPAAAGVVQASQQLCSVFPHRHGKGIAHGVFQRMIERHRPHGNTEAQHLGVVAADETLPGRAHAEDRGRAVVRLGETGCMAAPRGHGVRRVDAAVDIAACQKRFGQTPHVRAVAARVEHIVFHFTGGAHGAAGQIVGGQQQGALGADGVLQGADHRLRAPFHVAQAFQRRMDEQRVSLRDAQPRQAGGQSGARHVGRAVAHVPGAAGAAPRFQRGPGGVFGPLKHRRPPVPVPVPAGSHRCRTWRPSSGKPRRRSRHRRETSP